MFGKKTKVLILVFSIIFYLCSGSVIAEQEELSSSLTARTFYDIGYELYADQQIDFAATKQVIIFFNSAVRLDSKADYVLPDIINIVWQNPDENMSDAVELALTEYVDRSSDLEITSKAVGYLLERLDTREEREELLLKLYHKLQHKNEMFASDLSAQIGFLKAETADSAEAQGYLIQAFTSNKYNRLVFAKLVELAEMNDKQLPDMAYLENLRFAVRADPLDFDSVYSFAQHCELVGLYEPAVEAYRYCADLVKYLKGQQTLGPDLYRPWVLSCYNAGQYGKCQQMAAQLRSMDIFDVRIEAIASAAALQNNDRQSHKTIVDRVESCAEKILTGQRKASFSEMEDYTWYFNFIADVNSQEDLTWATKVYDAEPNSPGAASLFAYALVKNNQNEIAEPLLEKIETATQISDLAKGILLAKKGETESAKELLKKVFMASPGSFEAKQADEKLKEIDPDYESPPDMTEFKMMLQKDFGQSFFGPFVEPDKMVSMEFNIKGSTFSYGSQITGNLAIINHYSEPIVVCPDAMIKGNIRIDVQISGDLNEQIPALIVKTVRPSYEIRPGNALFIPLRLDTGRVKRILDYHPQAQLNLKYTAYLDPQISADGQVKDTPILKPVEVILQRRKLKLNTRYLQQRLDAIKKGHQGQKAKSAQLFAGLLAEQQKFRQTGPAYRFMYAEPELLSSALARCLAEDDWVLKVQTMATMLKLKLDYRLTEAVSEELNNPNWPVRLMAVFTLAGNQDEKFSSVLGWTAKNDSEPIVRELAAILMGDVGIDESDSSEQIEQNVPEETTAEQKNPD
ncbi:MAG: hypothetical protein JW806_03380 [Sedimentisphaerales bacterium]|nr:hypothetical protein [Sedimentisphaerales bacterium]